MMSRNTFLVIISFTYSCQAAPTAEITGHFENSNKKNLWASAHAQVVPPEWAESQAVVISMKTVTLAGVALPKALLDSVERLTIVQPHTDDPNGFAAERELLAQGLGSDFSRVEFVSHEPGVASIWARDWSPLMALSKEGALVLLDFNYFSDRDADDRSPQLLAKQWHASRVSLPVYNEGGNFMTDGRGNCFATRALMSRNMQPQSEQDREPTGYESQSEEHLRYYFEDYVGCKQLHLMPRMPHESTGHIDVWAKLISESTVLVGQVTARAISRIPERIDQADAEDIQRFLDQQAQAFAGMGYAVVRVPMPAPLIYGGLFRSYTNSLLLNGTLIAPSYVAPAAGEIAHSDGASSYPDADLQPEYEAQLRRQVESLGLNIRFVPADRLVDYGGAIHCATMQVPR